jgi:hypothetical protein
VAQNRVTPPLPCSLFDDFAADQSPLLRMRAMDEYYGQRLCPLLVNNSAMSRTFITSLPTRLSVRGNGIGYTLRVFTSISVFLLVTLCLSKLLYHTTKQASLVGFKIDDCASSNAVTTLEHVIGRETTLAMLAHSSLSLPRQSPLASCHSFL